MRCLGLKTGGANCTTLTDMNFDTFVNYFKTKKSTYS